MKPIKITTSYNKNYTSIPNFFIDDYLSAANGDFVKVYIWLIKQVDTRQSEITVNAIADTFNLTEADVIRAIKYWHKFGVISATWDQKSLTSIHILDKELTSNEMNIIPESNSIYETNTESKITEIPMESEIPVPLEPFIEDRGKKPVYTTNELVTYKTQDEYSQLVFITERFLGKHLTENDLRTLISLNDWLNLPFDVIEILIEHCVSNNHRKLAYIEKVAMDWADNGINTQEKAIYRTKTYSKQFFTIIKALGIQSRNPVQFEIDLMENWIKNFNMDVVLEACHRTVVQTNSGSMKYVDKILQEWQKKDVNQFSDIEILDQAYKAKKKTQSKTTKMTKPNKFNNYEQRDYDFDQLEKQALALRLKQTKGI